MADKRFSEFTDGLTNQSPTDELVGLDLSLPASQQNTRWTLNNLFSKITRNIADKVLRFQPGSSPIVSGNNESAIYSDGAQLLQSSNGSAYAPIGTASPAGSGSELQYRASATALGAVASSTVSGSNVTMTGTLQAKLQDAGGQVYNVKAFGAIGNGIVNDRAAIQFAIDTAYANGGGIVFFPVSSYAITPHALGYGLLMRDGVYLWGASKTGTQLLFNGTYTDSHIRGYSRDDDNPNVFEVVQISNLLLRTSASPYPLIDCTGWRYFTLQDLYLQGQGVGIADCAIKLSDRNLAATSHKSTFFGCLQSIGHYGPGFGTWIVFEQYYGDCNTHCFINHEGASRYVFDFTNAAGFDCNSEFINGYFAGSGSTPQVFKSDAVPFGFIVIKINSEGYAVAPIQTIFSWASTSGGAAEMTGLSLDYICDFQGQGPILAADLSSQFITGAGSQLAIVQTAANAVRIDPGVAFNTYRMNGLGQSKTLTTTNTGLPHTEYLVISDDADAIMDSRIFLRTSLQPNDYQFGSVSVDALGSILSVTDQRQIYATPAFRQMYLAGESAAPTTARFLLSGTPTAARSITIPDRSGVVALTDIQQKASDPSTSDVPSNTWALYKNTSSGAVKLWANDGGVMKSVALT